MKMNEKRYDDSVKLALALGEIDDKLVEEARVPYPIFMTTKRLVTIAASLLVVIVVGIAAVGLAPMIVPMMDKGGNASAPEASDKNNSPSAMYGVGELVVRGESNITLIDKTNGKYTFLLNLGEDLEDLDIYVYGYKAGADGAFKLTPVVATTADVTPEGYERIDMPKFLVNGSETNTVPTRAGTYTITIDTLVLKSAGCVPSSIGISYFNVGFSYN